MQKINVTRSKDIIEYRDSYSDGSTLFFVLFKQFI